MFICKRNDGDAYNHHGPGGGGGGSSSSSSSGGDLSCENLNNNNNNMMMMTMRRRTMSPRSVLEHRALSGLAIALPPPPPPPPPPGLLLGVGGGADHDLLHSSSSSSIVLCKQQEAPASSSTTKLTYYWARLGPDSVVSSPRAVDTGCLRMFATRPAQHKQKSSCSKAVAAAAAAAPIIIAANSASSGVDGSAAAACGVDDEDDDGAVAIPILQNAPSLASRSLPESHPHWHLLYEMDRHSTCSSSTESIFQSSPPSTNLYNPEFSVADDFLSRCYYCHSRLGPGKDIYMYRGDRAFCSAECRYEQIVVDERKEAH